MEVIGKVVSANQDKALVAVNRTSACSSCDSCAQSGVCHAQLTFGNQTKVVTVQALNGLKARVGDTVQIHSSTTKTLLTMFFVFVMPVVLTVLLYFLVQNNVGSEHFLVLILAFSFVFLFILCSYMMNLYAKKHINARIVKILQESKAD